MRHPKRSEVVPIEALPAGRTTSNMEAYNEYLVGKAHVDERGVGWRDKANAAFRRAIDLDPGFAPAYAWLAVSITVMSGPGPQWAEGRQLAEKALQLDPDLAMAHAAHGLANYYPGDALAAAGLSATPGGWSVTAEDRRQAEDSLKQALSLDPSLGFAYNILQIVLRDQDRESEANALLEQGLAVDPLNPPLVMNAAVRAKDAGNFRRAESLMLRLASLPEPVSHIYASLANLYEEWGKLDLTVAMAKEHVRLRVPAQPIECVRLLAMAYSTIGMHAEADYWLEKLGSNDATTGDDS